MVQASIDATGSPLTDEALEAAKNADAVFLGAIGGPVSRAPLIHNTAYARAELMLRL
jgi:isocitrate/isopropylmalate dehydrogenase